VTVPFILNDIRPSVRSLIRACAAAAIGAYERVSPAKIATREWMNDAGVSWLLRAPSAPLDLTTPGLTHTLVPDLMATLAPQSAAARIFRDGLQLLFGRDAQISVLTILGDPSLAAFVQEGYPIPVVQANVEPLVTLTPKKLACVVVLTIEMINSSNAEVLITDALFRSIALTLDSVLLDDQPASAARPAGLRYNVTPITADPSPDPVIAMVADMTNLYLQIAPVADRPPIVVNSLARTAKAQISSSHGLNPITAIGSITLRGTDDMIAIAPNVLVSAYGTGAEVSASREAALQMDTLPIDGAPAHRSTWQTDCIALKLRLPVTWALRTQAGVAWLTATHW
jgi:hypothetical protein